MRNCVRAVSTTLVAVIVLAWAAGVAPATVQVDRTRMRATSTSLTFTGGGVSVSCAMTLGITLSSSIIEPGAVAGSVTEGRINEAGCVGGSVRLLTGTLPWPVRLVSVREGQLRLRVERLAALADVGLGRCLFQGNMESVNDEDPITRLIVDEAASIPLFTSLSILCPAEASIRGAFAVAEEVSYIATEIEPPLAPEPEVVNFERRRQILPINFTNEWIVRVRPNVRGVIPEALRFVNAAEANECAGRAIGWRGRCTDRIELKFERQPGEQAVVRYFVRRGPFEMGVGTLSE